VLILIKVLLENHRHISGTRTGQKCVTMNFLITVYLETPQTLYQRDSSTWNLVHLVQPLLCYPCPTRVPNAQDDKREGIVFIVSAVGWPAYDQ